MNKHFDDSLKRLISLAVILMFAAAVIADQARARMPDTATPVLEFDAEVRDGILLDGETLQKIGSLPAVLGSLFKLTVDADRRVDPLTPQNGAGPDASR